MLTNAQYLAHLKIKGPEDLVFTSNGSVITGLSNGQLVEIKPNGLIEKLMQIGNEMDERVCGNLKSAEYFF
jgi:hypothetical protein